MRNIIPGIFTGCLYVSTSAAHATQAVLNSGPRIVSKSIIPTLDGQGLKSKTPK